MMELSNIMKHSDVFMILCVFPINEGKNLVGYVILEEIPRLCLLRKGINNISMYDVKKILHGLFISQNIVMVLQFHHLLFQEF